MKVISFFLLLLVPALAWGKPVYLKCLLTRDDGNRLIYEIKLDEDSGIITHASINLEGKRISTFNTKGFFSANEVSYQRIIGVDSLPITDTYTINRITLDISNLWTYEGSNNKTGYGTCEIEETKKNRKF